QKCTPLGYALHVAAELIGFFGLLLLIGVSLFLIAKWTGGTFHASLFWSLLAPFLLGILSEVLIHYSWWLAYKKGFQYDWEKREASWMEGDERRSFKYQR